MKEMLDINKIINTLYNQRDPHAIKSDYGRVLIIGSSKDYPFASLISLKACLMTGASFIAYSVPKSCFNLTFSRVYDTVINGNITSEGDNFYFDDINKLNYDAILFGNGINTTEENLEFLKELIINYDKTLILDASSLSLLALDPSIIYKKNKNSTIILTPHLGEAKRLFKTSFSSRDCLDFITPAKEYIASQNIMVLLKSYSSILVTKEEIYKSTYQPSANLAKAGSGDGLAGLITGFLAYGTKYYKKEQLIIFADELLHMASNAYASKHSSGLCDILKALKTIEDIISYSTETKKE